MAFHRVSRPCFPSMSSSWSFPLYCRRAVPVGAFTVIIPRLFARLVGSAASAVSNMTEYLILPCSICMGVLSLAPRSCDVYPNSIICLPYLQSAHVAHQLMFAVYCYCAPSGFVVGGSSATVSSQRTILLLVDRNPRAVFSPPCY